MCSVDGAHLDRSLFAMLGHWPIMAEHSPPCGGLTMPCLARLPQAIASAEFLEIDNFTIVDSRLAGGFGEAGIHMHYDASLHQKRSDMSFFGFHTTGCEFLLRQSGP